MEILETWWSYANWILISLGIGIAVYLYGTKNSDYFSKRKLPFIKPVPFIGTMGPMVLKTVSFWDYIAQMYNELKGHTGGGLFFFMDPIVMIRDPELIKAVTVKDFDSFTDHKPVVTSENDPLWGRSVFNLQGQKWRDMRSTLSPAFTSSKMKMMFVLVEKCGKQLGTFVEKCFKNDNTDETCNIEKDGDTVILETKDLFTRYTNDVIATTAFGIGVDSLMEQSNEFYLMGKDAVNLGGIRTLIGMGYFVCPKLMQMLNITFISTRVTNFFRSLVCDTMAAREREGIVRPDLIELLMQAKKGTLQDEKLSTNVKRMYQDDDFAAQAFTFFFAGFETTAVLMCFASHELALHPEIQTRLQEEIDAALEESGGNLTYEAVHNMKYLDMVLSETLRKYPPQAVTDRLCIRPYTLSTDPPLEMKPGDFLWIPIYGLHRDPEYFPDPEKFDPERFSEENKSKIKPFSYLPFGIGPRSCIGYRFALMEAKVAMVHMLSRFNFKVVSKTPIPIELTKGSFNMTVEGGLWLGLEQRKRNEQETRI